MQRLSTAVSMRVVHGIVSLSPSTTEVPFAVGPGPAAKGVTTACDYPEKAATQEAATEEAATRDEIGGSSARAISVEAIEPGLMFADLTRHQAVIESLERYGARVIATNATSPDDVFEVSELVGRATENGSQASTLVVQMRCRPDRTTAMTAVREGRVDLLDGDTVSRSGPRIGPVLDEMAQTLHVDRYR